MTTNANAITIGSDLSIHAYSLIDSVAIYNRALTDTEISDLYKRGALKISFQARSCASTSCAGQNFVGSGASSATFMNAFSVSSLAFPSYSLSGIVGANRYFQY